MELLQDEKSFAEPLRNAIDEAFEAVLNAGYPVVGSEERVRIALDEKRDLEKFSSSITKLLKRRGFVNLPKVRHGSETLSKCHQSDVGPWRGIFLVDSPSELVVALLFSKAPHRLDSRLDELVQKHTPKDGV